MNEIRFNDFNHIRSLPTENCALQRFAPIEWSILLNEMSFKMCKNELVKLFACNYMYEATQKKKTGKFVQKLIKFLIEVKWDSFNDACHDMAYKMINYFA